MCLLFENASDNDTVPPGSGKGKGLSGSCGRRHRVAGLCQPCCYHWCEDSEEELAQGTCV